MIENFTELFMPVAVVFNSITAIWLLINARCQDHLLTALTQLVIELAEKDYRKTVLLAEKINNGTKKEK